MGYKTVAIVEAAVVVDHEGRRAAAAAAWIASQPAF
jgi:hypothetical protein